MTNFVFKVQLVIIDAEYAKEFFQIHSNKYEWTDILFASDLYLKEGMVATIGNKWKKQRNSLSNVFHFTQISNKIPIIQQVANEKINEIKNLQINGKINQINIKTISQELAGEVIVRSFFGQKFQHKIFQGFEIKVIISQFIEDCANITMDPYQSIKRLIFGNIKASKILLSQKEKLGIKKIQALRGLAIEIIDKRLQNYNENQENKDLLHFCIKQYKQDEQQENKENLKEQIIQQFITMYFVGQDTTANVFTKILYMLPLYPEYYREIEQEVDQNIPNLDDISIDQLNKLMKLTNFIKEILRFISPIYILGFRNVLQEFYLCKEFQVKKGISIDVSFHAFLRDSKNFIDSDIFKPERFQQEDQYNQAYMPFGGGPRNCIGQYLAYLELKIFTVYFIKNFKIHIKKNSIPIKIGGLTLYQPLCNDLIELKIK